MNFAILLIVVGLIVLLALPPFLDGQIRKKTNRKSARMLCNIFGYLLIIYGGWELLKNLILE